MRTHPGSIHQQASEMISSSRARNGKSISSYNDFVGHAGLSDGNVAEDEWSHQVPPKKLPLNPTRSNNAYEMEFIRNGAHYEAPVSKNFLEDRTMLQGKFGLPDNFSGGLRSQEKTSIADREAFKGMARDIKASEHNASENRSTFEILRARGSFHKNDSDSEAEDVKDITRKYQN